MTDPPLAEWRHAWIPSPETEMKTFSDLRTHADTCLFEGRYVEALHGYTALLALEPVNLDARLRVADSLLAIGEVQRAAVVYTALARHATHAGHPLRALVALEILTTLEPLLGPLMASFAELYSRDSERLGRGVRIAMSDESRALPDGFALGAISPEALIVQAETRGADLTQAGRVYPKQLPPIPLLSELPAADFAGVLDAMKLRRTRRGEVVLSEGEPGHSFFVLARGTVAVSKQAKDGSELRLATLHDGAIFGEMALVSASPRTATVISETDCDLLELDREALTAASRSVATIALALDKFTRERLLNNLLATSPLFRPLDRTQRFDLVRRFKAHDVAAGVSLIDEGAPGRGLFVLLAGQVDVSKRDGEHKVLLATLGPGDVFGEISLLNEEPASATVTAAAQSTVLVLAKDVFARLVEAVPEIGDYVRSLGEERLLDTRLLLDAARPDLELELTDDDLILI
jgi:cAMP-dependent protein kinase regulator